MHFQLQEPTNIQQLISGHSLQKLAESLGFLNDAATSWPPCEHTTFRLIVPHGLTVTKEAATQAEPFQAQRGFLQRVSHDPHQLSALKDLPG